MQVLGKDLKSSEAAGKYTWAKYPWGGSENSDPAVAEQPHAGRCIRCDTSARSAGRRPEYSEDRLFSP